jgi:Icc-related predicted phosphoesterase
MFIDYISDLHENIHLRNVLTGSDLYYSFIDDLFHDTFIIGTALIIAGDMSESNERTLDLIKAIKERKSYTYIIYVPGNHDLYLHDRTYKKSIDKYNDLVKDINNLNHLGIYCLDGNIIELDGIKFGGAMGWYDDAYLKIRYPYTNSFKNFFNRFYKEYMRDSIMIPEKLYDLISWQRKKIESIYLESDVLISHVNPINQDFGLSEKYQNQDGNTFFCFDGSEFIEKTNAKHWVFGHTHEPIELNYKGIEFHCNPYGYPHEIYQKESFVKQFEFKGI